LAKRGQGSLLHTTNILKKTPVRKPETLYSCPRNNLWDTWDTTIEFLEILLEFS
jgi:hypothetical protein